MNAIKVNPPENINNSYIGLINLMIVRFAIFVLWKCFLFRSFNWVDHGRLLPDGDEMGVNSEWRL